jgi:hypothetical protein
MLSAAIVSQWKTATVQVTVRVSTFHRDYHTSYTVQGAGSETQPQRFDSIEQAHGHEVG